MSDPSYPNIDKNGSINDNSTGIIINPFSKSNLKENDPLLSSQSDKKYTTKIKIESYGVHNNSQSNIIGHSPSPNVKNGLSLQRSISNTEDKNAKQINHTHRQRKVEKKKVYKYKIGKYLDEYFEISKRGSTIMTEIRGGTVGFLTLAYIVLLNPQVLNVSGIPYEYAASSTCLASCIATLICGIFGNIPVGCGPGVGLSAYFSYGMMPQILSQTGISIDEAYLQGLFMAFLSGAIVFILTIPGIVTWIVNALPQFIKVATIVGMGLFLAFVGMVDVGLVIQAHGQGNAILSLGDMSDWIIWLSLLNCLLIATLKYFKINGSLLLCIIITSILYFAISEKWPTKFVDFPSFQDPLLVFNPELLKHLPAKTATESIVSFVLILFLDVSGVTFAIASICDLSDDPKTLKSFQKSAFIGTSIGSMIAGVLGCSPIIVCIETSSGAAAGARTGLSAIVISLYFFIAMFLGPVIGVVPAAATSPVLVYIGTLMMGQVGQIAWDNMRIAVPAFFCIAMMPFTYSISNGLFFGVGSFFLTWLSTGQFLQILSKYDLLPSFCTRCCGDFTEPLDNKYEYSNVTNPEKMRADVDYSEIINEYNSPSQKRYSQPIFDAKTINDNTSSNTRIRKMSSYSNQTPQQQKDINRL